jgi:hypothetical protein
MTLEERSDRLARELVRVFEVDGEEVQPLVPDKAAPADLFRLIREKRKAMEEVQPTAIVEEPGCSVEIRPRNSQEVVFVDHRYRVPEPPRKE